MCWTSCAANLIERRPSSSRFHSVNRFNGSLPGLTVYRRALANEELHKLADALRQNAVHVERVRFARRYFNGAAVV